MPEYSIPNWIKPADPAANFMEAYQTGARIAEANARLAESVRTSDMEHQLQSQRLEQQSRMEQQKLEVEKSYRDQQAEAKQEQLKQAQAVNQARIQEAGARLAETTKYNEGRLANEQTRLDTSTQRLQDLEAHRRETEALNRQIEERRSTGAKEANALRQENLDLRNNKKATYHLKSADGSYITGTTDDPAIASLLAKRKADADEAAKPGLLHRAWNAMTGGANATAPTSGNSLAATADALRKQKATGTGTTPQQITTKEQYDALAPGSLYIGKGGQQFRKPAEEPASSSDTPADSGSDTPSDEER